LPGVREWGLGGRAVQISPRIANLLRDIASAQGRSEEEVLDDALVFYLDYLGRSREVESGEAPFGPSMAETYRAVRGWMEDAERRRFVSLLDRISSRFDLDEDEAMRIAVEEQHAFRREGAEREGNSR
jgi:hypothetical protein